MMCALGCTINALWIVMRKYMKNSSPRVEWWSHSGRECLKFTFGETLSAMGAEIAIVQWEMAFESAAHKPVVLIWDCRVMKGYDSEARTKWTKALKEMKADIGAIWLITSSTRIKMGAAVMGMLSSIKIHTISSEDQIKI